MALTNQKNVQQVSSLVFVWAEFNSKHHKFSSKSHKK